MWSEEMYTSSSVVFLDISDLSCLMTVFGIRGNSQLVELRNMYELDAAGNLHMDGRYSY